MKVYISGKITGLLSYEAKRNFHEVEKKLIEHGAIEIFNPMREIPEELDYEEQMDLCLAALKQCQIAVFQANWEQSQGAKREFKEARKLGLHIRYATERDYDDIEQLLLRQTRFSYEGS